MKRARKEKWLSLAGLGIALVGGVWFGLAAAGTLLQGMLRIFGFPLGAGLVFSGLVMCGVYLWRWRRIENLARGKNLLAQWKDGESEVFIAPDCAYTSGNLHLWSGAGARLEKVAMVEKQSYGPTAACLEIEYANAVQSRDLVTGRWTRVWRSSRISIPIPADRIADGRRVAEKLQEKLTA